MSADDQRRLPPWLSHVQRDADVLAYGVKHAAISALPLLAGQLRSLEIGVVYVEMVDPMGSLGRLDRRSPSPFNRVRWLGYSDTAVDFVVAAAAMGIRVVGVDDDSEFADLEFRHGLG